MKTFFEVVEALEQGVSVRMSTWEAITRMYIRDGVMVCQRGEAVPYKYELSWREMQQKAWSLVETSPTA
jgi:hypothetical protein